MRFWTPAPKPADEWQRKQQGIVDPDSGRETGDTE
jgi:hypothetical protein